MVALGGLVALMTYTISPPRVPTKKEPYLSAKAMILCIFDTFGANSLSSEYFFSATKDLVQRTIFPSASPDNNPPFKVSVNAVTAALCYFRGLEQDVPLQISMLPFPIPLAIPSSPMRARLVVGSTGIFPKIPLLSLIFLPDIDAKTTYFAHPQTTYSSFCVNLRANIGERGPLPVASKHFLPMS